MTAQILQFPISDACTRLAARSRRVPCPYCQAPPGRPCVNRGTRQIHLTGPHPDRVAAAEQGASNELPIEPEQEETP